MKNFLCRAENALFSIIVFAILILNIYASVFLIQGYYPVYFKNHILIFIISLCLFLMSYFLFSDCKWSKKRSFYMILAIHAFCLLARIFLNSSFITGPTSDQAALIYSINDLVLADDYTPILQGGYLNVQSHLSSFYYFFYWPMKFFESRYSCYYHFNAVLIQISFLLFSLNAFKLRGQESGLFTAILLNLFIPSYFLDFVIYGDTLSLFFISLVLTIGINLKGFWVKGAGIAILLAFAYMSRATAVVWFIAACIAVIMFVRSNKRIIGLIGVMIFFFMLPSSVCTTSLNKKFNAQLPQYSLPSNTWISIGLNYNSNGDAGLYDSYSLDQLIDSNYDKESVKELNNVRILNALKTYQDPKELFSFMKNKLCNTWVDPDFETMSYIMPDNGITVEQFRNDPDLINGIAPGRTHSTNGLGDFIYHHFQMIRIYEKGYIFVILIISFIVSIINVKRKDMDRTSLFMQLNLVGYFLLQLFMETKPRYVLICFIILIVYCGFEWEKIKTFFGQIKLKRN